MRVLIVGAGIAGLSMALCLEKIGIFPQVIEKRKNLSPDGAGIALPLNAVHALCYLGLKERLIHFAHIVNSITYALPNDEILSTRSLAEYPLNQYPFVALHRKDLLTILADSIQSKIEFNKSVSDITFDHVDIAKVTFSDNVTENFNLVIGADGINSTLRRTLTQPHSLEDLGISTWRFIANFQQADPIYYFGKQSAFMIYPISKTQAYCYAHTSDPTDKRLIKKEQLPLVFSDYTAKVNEIIDATPRDNIIFGRLTSVTKPIFSYHNIAFIGDAAHACSPMLQQGAALAFEDAITLSQIINKTKNIKKILSYYEAIREPRVTWVRENSDGPIKSMAFSQSDDEYNKRNQLIKTNGPINIQKWKVLFSKNYINELNDQILLYL